MKKMYNTPETDTISVEMTTTLCNSQTVGFGTGSATGPALAPNNPNHLAE